MWKKPPPGGGGTTRGSGKERAALCIPLQDANSPQLVDFLAPNALAPGVFKSLGDELAHEVMMPVGVSPWRRNVCMLPRRFFQPPVGLSQALHSVHHLRSAVSFPH